jgi:hypothetical protein
MIPTCCDEIVPYGTPLVLVLQHVDEIEQNAFKAKNV